MHRTLSSCFQPSEDMGPSENDVTNHVLNMQVTLYQLLMEERYGQVIERGLLWYLSEALPEVVVRSPYEVRPYP